MPIWIFRRSTDDRLLVTAVQTGADPETFQDLDATRTTFATDTWRFDRLETLLSRHLHRVRTGTGRWGTPQNNNDVRLPPSSKKIQRRTRSSRQIRARLAPNSRDKNSHAQNKTQHVSCQRDIITVRMFWCFGISARKEFFYPPHVA
jgi:hypothetical protein